MNPQDPKPWRFCVSPDHPCLAGHFPGQPVVPAVLMLDEVAAALRQAYDLRLARIVSAKFLMPLLPDQGADLQLSAQGSNYRFQIMRGTSLVAQGTVEGST